MAKWYDWHSCSEPSKLPCVAIGQWVSYVLLYASLWVPHACSFHRAFQLFAHQLSAATPKTNFTTISRPHIVNSPTEVWNDVVKSWLKWPADPHGGFEALIQRNTPFQTPSNWMLVKIDAEIPEKKKKCCLKIISTLKCSCRTSG